MSRSDRNEILKEMSIKLQAEVDFLKLNFLTIDNILTIANTELKKPISRSHLSKMQRVYLNDRYLHEVNERTYIRIFKALDDHIEKEYGVEWNGKKMIPFKNEIFDPRLEGLIGVYEGYSWDQSTTDRSKEETIYHFKVNVNSLKEIICETERTTFTAYEIDIISDDRIGIKFSSTKRQAYFVILIGRGDENVLRKEQRFLVSYADSGDIKIKSGLAIIERSEKKFEEITPQKMLFSQIRKIKDSHFINFLHKAQLIID